MKVFGNYFAFRNPGKFLSLPPQSLKLKECFGQSLELSVQKTLRPKVIFGGDPPDWWSAEERSRFFSSLHMAILHFSVTRTKAIWQRCPRAATHPHRLTSRLFLATYTVSRKSMENPNKKTTTGLAVWSMSFALFFGSREKVTG